MYIKDLSDQSYAAESHEEVKVKAIGWLGNFVPRTGSVPAEFMELLDHLYERHNLSEGDLGYHICEICNDYISNGELWLNIDDIRYVMPLMIRHYIIDHNYTTPPEFILKVIDFWKSPDSNLCKEGKCDVLPIDSFKGFHGKEDESLT